MSKKATNGAFYYLTGGDPELLAEAAEAARAASSGVWEEWLRATLGVDDVIRLAGVWAADVVEAAFADIDLDALRAMLRG